MDASELIRSLASEVCPACARRKKSRQTFCGKCYFRLTPDLRSALYRLIGAGYEQAFAAAKAFLGTAQVDVPPTAVEAAQAANPSPPDKPAQGELFGTPGPKYRI